MKLLKNKIHQSFKKIRINPGKKESKDTDIDNKITKIKQLKKDLSSENIMRNKHLIEDQIDNLESEVAVKCAESNVELIKSHAEEMSVEGQFNNNKMWKLKQKIMPRKREVPTAKFDKNGTLVTNPSSLKKIVIEAFVDRLKSRNIIPEFEKLKALREELFHNRISESKLNKSADYSMKQLESILSKLKTGKAKEQSKTGNVKAHNKSKKIR